MLLLLTDSKATTMNETSYHTYKDRSKVAKIVKGHEFHIYADDNDSQNFRCIVAKAGDMFAGMAIGDNRCEEEMYLEFIGVDDKW